MIKSRTARRDLIDVALGNEPADTLVAGGKLVNVATGEIYGADVAIKGDRIAAVGAIEYARGSETKVIDAAGKYLTPGLIETHLHCYHSYIGVNEFTEAMLAHGVTVTADGFYGQGIVGGREAVAFFKQAFEATPLKLIFLVPTLAYLQNRDIGVTPAKGISAEEMFEMLDWDGCRGLEEASFLPITQKFEEFMDLFEATVERGQVLSGHGAGITERELQAFAAMGVSTDHEVVECDDALAKARAGMKVLMRQGTLAYNLHEVAPAHTEHGIDARAFAMSTDLASPDKLVTEGTIDEHVRVAIANGIAPIRALQMATINAAEAFGLQQEIGSISPGRYADILLVDDLVEFRVGSVMAGGEVIVEDGELLADLAPVTYPADFYDSIKVAAPLAAEDLSVEAPDHEDVVVRVIGINDGDLITEERRARLRPHDGHLQADLEQDVLPITMVDRNQKGTGIGVAFVQGFGLTAGALASSVSTISCNLVAVGTNDADMAIAMNRLVELGGGMIAVRDGETVGLAELPLLGLQSQDPLEVVRDKFARLRAAARDLGCPLADPFTQLEFCFVGGSTPALKMSEEGLVRLSGETAERVELIVRDRA